MARRGCVESRRKAYRRSVVLGGSRAVNSIWCAIDMGAISRTMVQRHYRDHDTEGVRVIYKL